jgi:uncharacterized protein (TIGR03083 family)
VHLRHLRAESAAFSTVLRTTSPDVAVPTCPGWRLRDLAVHLGGVHRWATTIVSTGERATPPTYDVADLDLADWFDEGANTLHDVLGAADPAQSCWTFGGSGRAAFWARRQALETAVHRVDAELTQGGAAAVPDDLAEDGIAEVVDVMQPRQVALGRSGAVETCVALVSTSSGRRWSLGEGEPVASVTGPPSALLLLLWHRLEPGDTDFQVSGSAAVVEALLAQGVTP